MTSLGLAILLMGVAFVVATLLYPYVLAFARRRNIVDNPSARKLQRIPVPVMGGTVVFLGLLLAAHIGYIFVSDPNIPKIIALLAVMYIIGVWDDIKDVSAAFRFMVELVVVWLMIFMLGVEINDLHGLWGIHEIPDVVSVPLSLIAGVGIMNAINLIDGVDGYCSTFCVMACAAFAVIFYNAGDMTMFATALITIGAVIPFFFHNVFGRTSKMFMGDGGSLMLGTLLALFVFSTLSKDSACAKYGDQGISLTALALAILAVPVFDTLKVMIARMVRGQSPFHPDKTHLHHLFIDLNFSHIATSGAIVFGNVVIVSILLLSWGLGASINVQNYIVIAAALLFTWGFYFFMVGEQRKNYGEGSLLFQAAAKRGKATNFSRTATWLFIRKVVDSRFLGQGFMRVNLEPKSEVKKKSRPDPRVQ